MICLKEEHHRIEHHLKEGELVVFIGWLTVRRELKAKTIDGYLSGLRQLYIGTGMKPPMKRTNLVACLLERAGAHGKHKSVKRRYCKARKLPVTIRMMRLLKETTRVWDATTANKLLVWAICLLEFYGAIRIHKLLCKLKLSLAQTSPSLLKERKEKAKTMTGT